MDICQHYWCMLWKLIVSEINVTNAKNEIVSILFANAYIQTCFETGKFTIYESRDGRLFQNQSYRTQIKRF